MKKFSTLIVTAIVALTISSCSKDPITLTYSMDDMTACLIADPYQNYQTFTFNLNHDQVAAILTSNSVELSRVREAKLAKIKAVIVTGGTSNFDQIANIEVYMKAVGASGDGEQVAYTPSIGDGAVEVAFSLHGNDIKSVLSEDKVITVKVLNRAAGNAPVCIKLTESQIEVKAKG